MFEGGGTEVTEDLCEEARAVCPAREGGQVLPPDSRKFPEITYRTRI